MKNAEFVEQVDLFVLKYRMKLIQFGEKKNVLAVVFVFVNEDGAVTEEPRF